MGADRGQKRGRNNFHANHIGPDELFLAAGETPMIRRDSNPDS